jgi:hypothetical protein
MNASLLLTDVETFLNVARPLDELCARVDQTIAMHLVSRGSISGTELRAAVENLGFELGVDGAFRLPNEEGEPLFTLVTLDNTPFTASLLSSQAYRGFSMLFDITHVPAGEKQFNRFMDLAVKLSSTLSLDLVNDKLKNCPPNGSRKCAAMWWRARMKCRKWASSPAAAWLPGCFPE